MQDTSSSPQQAPENSPTPPPQSNPQLQAPVDQPVDPQMLGGSTGSHVSPQNDPLVSVPVQSAPNLTAAQVPVQPPVLDDEKIWAAISYIPLMAFLSLMVKPRSAYVKLHARQGILLCAIFIFSLFVTFFLVLILPLWMAWLFFSLSSLLHLALLIIGIYSIYQALICNWWKIPILGVVAEKIPVDSFSKIASEAITGQAVENSQEDGNEQSQ